MRHRRINNYEVLEEMVEEYKDGNVIIGGDFNAKTGKEGRAWGNGEDEEEPKVQDKVINAEGEELLGDNGLTIANGNKQGDEEGGITYIGARGMTTIDYVLKNIKGKAKIKYMRIGKSIKANIVPLEVELKVSKEQERQREIIDWSEEGKEAYKRWSRAVEGTTKWKEVNVRIANAIPRKRVGRSGKEMKS